MGQSDVGRGDKIQKYLTIVNSHDGTMPFRFYITPVRIFCKNVLSRNFRYKSKEMAVAIRHTKTAQTRLDNLNLKLKGIKYTYQEILAKYREFKTTFLQKAEIEKFIKNTINWDYEKEDESTRKQNIYSEIEDRVYNGHGNSGETLWDAYNGVIEWHDHKNIDDPKHTIFKPNIKERAYQTAEAILN